MRETSSRSTADHRLKNCGHVTAQRELREDEKNNGFIWDRLLSFHPLVVSQSNYDMLL